MNSIAYCKHLIQPANGVKLAGTATVFTCPWCAIERLERENHELETAANDLTIERASFLATLHEIADEPRIPGNAPSSQLARWAYKLHGIAARALAGSSPAETPADPAPVAAEHTVVASPAKVTIPEAATGATSK